MLTSFHLREVRMPNKDLISCRCGEKHNLSELEYLGPDSNPGCLPNVPKFCRVYMCPKGDFRLKVKIDKGEYDRLVKAWDQRSATALSVVK